MADYKETEVTGKSWQRASRVLIENPYGGIPMITFQEEEATEIGNKTVTRGCGSVGTQFDAQNADHVTVYTILNSLYMALAAARDETEEVS